MVQPLPKQVDTCVIGNGPAALILSYILHGHIPYYCRRHQDELLHSKLCPRRDLLDLSPDLYAHFQSSLRYSTQALPVNTLFDTLIRPNADTEVNPKSLVVWRKEPHRAISHLVLGNASSAGGQWTDNPVSASDDIGALSYAEMLSLPGYSYAEHYLHLNGFPIPEFERPSRKEVAKYYACYPAAVGISPAMRTSTDVSTVSRIGTGDFLVHSGIGQIRCKHLVLASGIFSHSIPSPPILRPLSDISNPELPLLVVGSGFSAADVITSLPPARKIIHLFKWQPDSHPSPLKSCHHQAYPEYAGIYRQMKLAASLSYGLTSTSTARSSFATKKRNAFAKQRDWVSMYEGLPEGQVLSIVRKSDKSCVARIRTLSGAEVEREVGGLVYVVGRRGTLGYLDQPLQEEVLGGCSNLPAKGRDPNESPGLISGRTFRKCAELDLEVARNVFIIGSLTGDSLVRHAVGGCVYVASRIMGHLTSSPSTPLMKGNDTMLKMNGTAHEDLHLDRKEMVEPY